jgi:hypothetical protein
VCIAIPGLIIINIKLKLHIAVHKDIFAGLLSELLFWLKEAQWNNGK